VTSNEDFLFAQEAIAQGYVTEAQVEEGLALQKRMAEELRLDEGLSVILVKRGWLAEDQARRVAARIDPGEGAPGQIHGYRLLEVVGRGAMGTVYRAVHLGLNREVAIKILRPDLAGDATQVERLRAEAAMLASLDHPNIVRALDAGESNGFPYVVMEFVEGETLRDRLRREGALPEAEALRIARALADALERARRMGVVHRDVKPGNVLLTRSGQPKLMDLGLAKGPIDLGLTQHGATVGTPQYIAPEQAVDPRKADTRSDIYALGATLYAMLTGRPPFDGHTLAEILTKVLYEVPTPVRALVPAVSPETGYLVERMMLRDPSLRYRTPAQVVADIDRLTQGTSILPSGFSGNWEAWLLRRRVRSTAAVAGVSVLSAVVVAVGISLWQGHAERTRLQRDVEDRIAATPFAVSPMDGSAALAARLKRTEALLADARRVGSGRATDLAGLVRELKGQLHLFDVYQALLRERVDPALKDGDHEKAYAALRELVDDKLFVSSPARSVATERLRAVEKASDEALMADRRKNPFRAQPRDLDDVLADANAWLERLPRRYAPTALRAQETNAAADAAEAARRLHDVTREEALRVAGPAFDRGVGDLRLAGLLADLKHARSAAEAVLADVGPALTAPDHRYVLGSQLAVLVSDPFDRAATELDERVRQAWLATAARARDAEAAGDPEEALAIYDRFARAAGEQSAFPAFAQEARAAHDQLLARTREEVDAAQTALSSLTGAVVLDLRKGALADLEARVVAARAMDVYRPVASALDALAGLAPTLRDLSARALQGLLAHRGPEKALWLDSLQFRAGAAPLLERQVEILDVQVENGTFTYRALRGGALTNPLTRPVDDLAEEELFRLAVVAPGSPDALALRALHALATLPILAEDWGVAIGTLQEVLARFTKAEDARSPLAAWTEQELGRREAEARENEEIAKKNLESAKAAYRERFFSEAYSFFRTLVERAEEPTLNLPITKVARENVDYVQTQMRRIRVESHLQDLELLLTGVKVNRREGAGGDALDVDLTYDFDRPVQLKNFTAGWARLVTAGQGRVLTPTSATGSSLRLNPDGDGQVVRDRPLVHECPFDPAHEMSVTFWLWPETPVFLAVDLDGAQVGILSADPRSFPEFPPDVPRLEHEAKPPKYDVYGRGRGVTFRAATDFGEPDRWGWNDAHQGRHFVPPDVDREARKAELPTRLFAFGNRETPYKVRFVRTPDKGVRLEVDDRDVWSDASAAMRAPKPSGRIAILTFTPCVIDDLVLSGRIDSAWLERHRPSLTK